MSCPCESGRTFDACCGPYLDGAPAPTAEALMRSRYTAYARVHVDHIMRTHDPKTLVAVDRADAERWARSSTWLGLEVLASEGGGPQDDVGTVSFEARYRSDGRERLHRERSRFRKIDGRWHYVDGKPLEAAAPVVAPAKPGRNEPCPCGSGAKYKRCHGA